MKNIFARVWSCFGNASCGCAALRRGVAQRSRRIVTGTVLALLLLTTITQAEQTLPPILNDVRIDQQIGTKIPADLVFHDEAGNNVKLGDYFGKRPIILTLVYFQCPMLCTTTLNELNAAMNVMSANAGQGYDVLTISFDPREKPPLAAEKKKMYLRQYRRPGAENGWHFLTGDADSIDKLTKAVGFHYVWDDKFQQYAHPSGLVILEPDGTISRYFFGINYVPNDLRLSLDEASKGHVGSVTDQILLYCYHYDPTTGRYTLRILNLLKFAAGATIAVLGIFWALMIRREKPARLT